MMYGFFWVFFAFFLFAWGFFCFFSRGSKYLVVKSREASVFSMLIQSSPIFLEGFQEVVEGTKSPESVQSPEMIRQSCRIPELF